MKPYGIREGELFLRLMIWWGGDRVSEAEQEHVVDVLMQWIGRQMKG